MIIEKIISGGQNGADLAGLEAARLLGIPTGGLAPKGYRVCNYDGSDGVNLELKTKYNLEESVSTAYPPRTRSNILHSDCTLWFGYEYSPGGKLTINTCQENEKTYIINGTIEEIIDCIKLNNCKIVNVAGNRTSEFNPNIYSTTLYTMYEVLNYIVNVKDYL
jgi:hypothetical protein